MPDHHPPVAGITIRPSSTYSQRRGFTLVEALVAIAVAGLAASALMLGLYSSLSTTEHTLEQTVARGIAEQIIDETLGKRYAAPGSGPYQVGLGPNSYELSGNGRERFNDTDDPHGFGAQPPEDRYGVALGTDDGAGGTRHPHFRAPSDFFTNWREEIEVYYVNESNPSVRLTGSQTSNLRAVEVKIMNVTAGRDDREIVRVRRVFSYVPQL